MVTCVDTSFLFAIYGNDVHSPRALQWLVSQHVPLAVTSLNEFELANALRFAEWRGAIARGEAGRFWADFEADRAAGRISHPECNFSTVIKAGGSPIFTRSLLDIAPSTSSMSPRLG